MRRRLFLQGVGGAALAAPYLSSLAPRSARAQTEYPTNLAIYFHHNGCLKANYRKEDVRNGPLDLAGLTTFTDLVGLEHKMLQIRGLDLGVAGFSGVTYMGETITFDPHDQGTGSKLTAAPYNQDAPRWSQGISFDHFIAGLIQPGVDPLVFSPTRGFADIKGVVSYKVAGDGKAFTPESNPGKLYSSLTGALTAGVASPTTQADAKVLRGQSILDLANGDLQRLAGKNISVSDKQRLEAWSELLRAAESVVIPAGCNTDVALALGIDEAAVTAAGGTSGSTGGGGGGFGGGGGGNVELQMTVGMEVMQKLAALHMVCGMNRVVLQHNQSFITYNFGGMTSTADHHGVSHRTGSAAVSGADEALYEPMIKEIDTFLGAQYAKFVKVLDGIPQGSGTTLLDYSGLLWLPELGDGMAHDNQDLPITIAGGMAGFLQQGVIVDGKPASTSTGGGGGQFGGGGGGFGVPGTPLNQLYVSLAHGLGRTEVESFGMADTSDADAGITKPGALSVIHAA